MTIHVSFEWKSLLPDPDDRVWSKWYLQTSSSSSNCSDLIICKHCQKWFWLLKPNEYKQSLIVCCAAWMPLLHQSYWKWKIILMLAIISKQTSLTLTGTTMVWMSFHPLSGSSISASGGVLDQISRFTEVKFFWWMSKPKSLLKCKMVLGLYFEPFYANSKDMFFL